MSKIVLAIDQGTTGTKAIVIDDRLRVLAEGMREFPQIYPRPGLIEHDPEAIWKSVRLAVRDALRQAKISAGRLAAAAGRDSSPAMTLVRSRQLHHGAAELLLQLP